jgi:NAD(P)-dependent dehydrogenase (short-subunit alcohol dehydrogenase family)
MAPLVPRLCERGQGRIVAIASVAAFRGLPNSPGYCASKAGLRAYAEALRPRVMRYGVGVTVVCPGFFTSPMTARWQGPTPFLASGTGRAAKPGHRPRLRRHFPWPLVFGMRFCDIAPADRRRDPAPLPLSHQAGLNAMSPLELPFRRRPGARGSRLAVHGISLVRAALLWQS